jgi:hypothetical protein
MVESLGYRIKRLFVGVFVAGSALAGLGGVMWGLYQQSVVPQMGAQVNVLIFIVIIIGGLGSTLGALIGALLVGLMANYTGFLVPKVALFSNIALMVAILLWRPQGVYPVTSREEPPMLHDSSPTTCRAAAGWRRCCWSCSCWPGARALPVPGREGAQRGGQDADLHRAGGQLRPAAGLHRHRQLRAHHVLRHRRLRRGDRAQFGWAPLGRAGAGRAGGAGGVGRCCCRW